MNSAADPLLTIELLNHASVLIESSGIALLTDPWYSGYAFEEGWGLKYANDAALARASRATHLWISHFHEDHFHIPTLKALAELNPDMILLANRSHNFDIGVRARSLGFRNILAFEERRSVDLGGSIRITRYPTTGIDNMLLIEGPGWRILNFNDCVIPRLSRGWLARKLGSIDIFMSNFNHAGKLLHRKQTDDSRVRRALIENFRRNYEPFDPSLVVPFASHHYYRAPESSGQNSSMLSVADLAAIESRVAPLTVGARLSYLGQGAYRISDDRPQPGKMTAIERTQSVPFDELRAAAHTHARKIRSGFGPLARLLPPLRVRLADLDRMLTLSMGRSLEIEDGAPPDIECHSAVALRWLTKGYGTDSFAVGAHFRILSARKKRLILHLAMAMLVENRLDPKSLLTMLFSRTGLSFLWNRREEIVGILLSGRIYADYHKE